MSDVYNQSPAMMAARGQVAKGQTYGKRKQQEDAQRAVPMGRAPVEIQAQQAAQVRRPTPNAPGSLTAPTARPNEPITAGAPFGAGPGPEAMGLPMIRPSEDVAVSELRRIMMSYPSDELADLLDAYESQA